MEGGADLHVIQEEKDYCGSDLLADDESSSYDSQEDDDDDTEDI